MLQKCQEIICTRAAASMVNAVILTLSLLVTSYAGSGDRVLPIELENKMAADRNPDDHKAVADLYQNDTQRLEEEATLSEGRATRLKRMAIDPKGVQRSLLLSKANTNRKQGGIKMEQAHMGQAEMKGMDMEGMDMSVKITDNRRLIPGTSNDTYASPGKMETLADGLALVFSTEPSPPRVGENRMVATVTDATGNPVSRARVRLTYTMPFQNMTPATVPLREEQKGVYEAIVNLSMGGLWDIQVGITQRGHAEIQETYSVTAGGGKMSGMPDM
ncbi:MAG: FixH family protein [Nitrospirales bacterium]|nr:FixH family protein [Nitrospirales bacterium]